MKIKSLAIFFLSILFFLLLVYCGLNASEKGILELTALREPAQALLLEVEDGKLVIIFAGEKYSLPYKAFLRRHWRHW
ncbi:MAG: hypothetical protein GX996_10535 [Firmicutes bacterium]|nr:hypothetical protein [Bacillota bacterium]